MTTYSRLCNLEIRDLKCSSDPTLCDIFICGYLKRCYAVLLWIHICIKRPRWRCRQRITMEDILDFMSFSRLFITTRQKQALFGWKWPFKNLESDFVYSVLIGHCNFRAQERVQVTSCFFAWVNLKCWKRLIWFIFTIIQWCKKVIFGPSADFNGSPYIYTFY